VHSAHDLFVVLEYYGIIILYIYIFFLLLDKIEYLQSVIYIHTISKYDEKKKGRYNVNGVRKEFHQCGYPLTWGRELYFILFLIFFFLFFFFFN
jgi:hypothetical protein